MLNPVPGLPSTPIVISAQTFADVPYGVNPFGKNANQRPLPQPSTPIVVPVFAAPRNAAVQPRSLVPPPTVLALPRPIQPVQQRVISASANQVVFSSPPLINQFKPLSIIETRPQQLRALPVIDRSLGNEINARILRQDQEINPDGSYQFAFETDNGITRSEIGTPKVLSAPGQEPVVAEQVSGSYSYFDNGVKYEVTYIADENGFRASVSLNEI